MRIARYLKDNNQINYCWVNEDKIGRIEGSIFGSFIRLEANIDISDVKLIAPIEPSKIICIGRNYLAHAKEHEVEVPEVPLLFLKPPSSIIGYGESIILPPQSQLVEHEAELVIVIGRDGRWIPPEDALNYVFGYTIGNDVTARDLQRRDGQWTRAKGFDTFCPIGPWVETDFNPSDAMVTCSVNNEIRQMASTRDMIFSVKQLIAYASSVMTLCMGDLIFTGTPAGVGVLKSGEIVEISIEGIGTLLNPVN